MTEKPHRIQLRKLHFALRAADSALPAHLPALLALTDPIRTPDPTLYAKTLPVGSGLIYRHFGAPDAHMIATALRKIACQRQLYLMIGNDPKLAMKVGADGVHWPERHLSKAKHWQGRFLLQTGAVHSRQAIQSAAQNGSVDAVLLSTVFSSNSPTAKTPIGARRFRKLAKASSLPLYALGGLRPDNMQAVANYGGLAAIDGLRILSAGD